MADHHGRALSYIGQEMCVSRVSPSSRTVRRMARRLLLALSILAVLQFLSPPHARVQPPEARQVPVRVGGEADLDACGGLGEVSGLDPAGDAFLSVRAGPGRRYAERDRLGEGRRIWLCDERGPWIGVVYGPSDATDCQVSSPVPDQRAYGGPCRSGWVHQRFVALLAG